MKMEYDPLRDLLYLWFQTPGTKAARAEVISAGVHADFDREGRLLGIEVLDASELMQQKVQLKWSLERVPA